MADITFACPKCDQELEAPEDVAGATVECPGCGADIRVPGKPRVKSDDPDDDDPEDEDEEIESADAGDEDACPECGAEMEPDAVLCLSCGYHTRLGRRVQTDLNRDNDDAND